MFLAFHCGFQITCLPSSFKSLGSLGFVPSFYTSSYCSSSEPPFDAVSFNSHKFWLFHHCFLFTFYCQHINPIRTQTHTSGPLTFIHIPRWDSTILHYNHSFANSPNSSTLPFHCQYFHGKKSYSPD